MKREPSESFKDGLRLREGPMGSSYYYKFKFKGETYHGSCDTADESKAKAYLGDLKSDLRAKARRQEWTRLSLPLLSTIWADWLAANEGVHSPKHSVFPAGLPDFGNTAR